MKTKITKIMALAMTLAALTSIMIVPASAGYVIDPNTGMLTFVPDGEEGNYTPSTPSDTTPSGSGTPEQTVTVPEKPAQNKPAPGSVRFSDVPADAWYAEAVNAMADAGVVNGYSDGKFHPNATITLGEAATVAWRLYGTHVCSAEELRIDIDTGRGSPYWKISGTTADGTVWREPVHWAGPVAIQVYTPAFLFTHTTYIAGMLDQPVSRGRAISTVVDVLTKGGAIDDRMAKSDRVNMAGTDIPDWNIISDPVYESNKETGNNLKDGRNWNYLIYPDCPVKTGFAGTWRTEYVLKGYQAGVVNGVDATGRCNPAATVTRAEFCQMLLNAGLPDPAMDGKYTNFTCSFDRNGKSYDYDRGVISDGFRNSLIKN